LTKSISIHYMQDWKEKEPKANRAAEINN